MDGRRRRRHPFDRALRTFGGGPPSARFAIRLIAVATVSTTVLAGVIVWVLDRQDFPTLGDAWWWALQTVTTVGYGDVTPKSTIGRVIGGVILLYSVAFLTILSAAITTSLLERARRERHLAEGDTASLDTVMARLDEIAGRLRRIEEGTERRTEG